MLTQSKKKSNKKLHFCHMRSKIAHPHCMRTSLYSAATHISNTGLGSLEIELGARVSWLMCTDLLEGTTGSHIHAPPGLVC